MVVNNLMNAAIDRMVRLGLSVYEAKAYTALLREHPLTAYEIAKNSGIPTSKIYEVMRKLESRHMIQSVHGEGSKIFIPASLDEFIQDFRSAVEDNLHAVNNELKDIKAGMDTSYTWHIKDYDGLMQKTLRMLKTAESNILMLVCPTEINALFEGLQRAGERGIKIAVIHYGATNMRIGQLYRHPVEDTMYADRGLRGFSLVVDSREALVGNISDRTIEAIWSMNHGFVLMAEDYMRHDIYFMKTVKRFGPLLQDTFGQRYEKLVDVYSDGEI
jgi:sugar-specific transcriptional regulator TrmB